MNPLPFVIAEWRESKNIFIAMTFLIAMSMTISLSVTSIERAVREATSRAADRFDLVVGAAENETQLVLTTVYLQPAALRLMPPDVLEKLRADRGVDYAAPVATGDSYLGYPIVGTTSEFAGNFGKYQLTEGRWFTGHDEAVVGARTTLKIGDTYTPLHGSANENLIEQHAHVGTRVKVVGRIQSTGTPWDKAIMVPFEAVLDLHHEHLPRPPTEEDEVKSPQASSLGIPAIVVKPHSVMDAYRLRNLYRRTPTTAIFPAETLTALYRLMGDARELALWIASTGQLLACVAIFLGLYAVLGSRAKALVSLRAIGASRLFVFTSLWSQAFLILLAGALIGYLSATLVVRVFSAILSDRLDMSISASLIGSDLWPLAVLVVAGGLASALVAIGAYRIPSGRALRS